MSHGAITSKEVERAQLAKTYMWRKSAELTPGLKFFPEQEWPTIDAKWVFPLEVDGDFPVPEGAIAKRVRVDNVEFGASMEMAEFRWMITDWAKARALGSWTQTTMQKRGAEYLAKCQNRQIIDALYAGAGATTVTVGAGNEWDANGPNMDIANDIISAWNYILDESNVDTEIPVIGLVYPTKVAGVFKTPKLLDNVMTNLKKYLGESIGLVAMPTRYYNESTAVGIQDDAIVFVPGEETLIHAAYRGNAVPMAEVQRVFGVGDEYIVKKMFFSKVQPDSQTDATSDRICKIANVI